MYIPGWVEVNQIIKIAGLTHDVDPEIPFTILAFFPAYKLSNIRKPTLFEMIKVFLAVKDVGLKNVKMGNCHVFARTKKEWDILTAVIGIKSLG